MIEIWIPIGISFGALAISVLSLYVSWFTKNPDFHFEEITPEIYYGVQRVIVTNDGFGEGLIYEECGITTSSWRPSTKTRFFKIPLNSLCNGIQGPDIYGSDSAKSWDDGSQLLKVNAKDSVTLPFKSYELHQILSDLNVQYIRFYAKVTSGSPIKKTKVIFSKKISVNDLKNAIPYPQVIVYPNEQ